MARLGLRLRDDRLPFAELTGLVQTAEAQGYEIVFVPEAGGREVFTQLAAFACATERIRLSPGIANVYTRSPTLLAQAAATLDQLSNGRAVLGLGTGHEPALRAGHGVAFGKPLQRMREYTGIIKAILRGDTEMPPAALTPVTQFHLETRSRADLSIYLAALGPRMCQLAGELADGVLLNWATPAYVEEALANVRLGAERAGRDPASIDIACYLRVSAGASAEELRHALAREVARYINMPFYRAMFESAGFAAYTPEVAAAYPEDQERAARLVSDVLLDALTVADDKEALAARLEQYRALGVKLPVLAPVPCGPDRRASWRAAITLV